MANQSSPPRPEDAMAFLNSFGQKSGGGLSKLKGKNGIKFIGLIAGVLLLVIAILSLMFGGNALQDQLVAITAKQEDLIRYTSLAQKNGRSSDLVADALVMNQFLTTDHRDLSSYLTKVSKVKQVDKKTKVLLDKKTDTKLTTSVANNRFDDDYKSLVGAKVASYQKALIAARKKASGTNLKKILDQAISNSKAVTF